MKTSIVFPSRFLAAGAVLIAIFLPLFASDASAACVAPPAGLVSWWRGETNALDHTGTNHGTLAGNTVYGAGRVGEGFVMDGSMDLVTVGNPTELQLQDFTIETWIKRGSSSAVSFGSFGIAVLFGYGSGGYALYMDPSGTVGLTKVGFDAVSSGVSITDTNFHHVAVTKLGSTVVFYVDGVAYPAAAYNPGFTFTTVAAIGARGDNLDNSFLGAIDEVSVYSRALATNEIPAIYSAGSAGKCVSVSPPNCAPATTGLVSWWRGEANALDQVGTNNGTLAGNTTYGLARVGQGFVFDGNGSVVQLGNPANLHFQDLTIETWIRRTSASVVSFNGNGNGHIFGFNNGGYGLYMDPSGTPHAEQDWHQ